MESMALIWFKLIWTQVKSWPYPLHNSIIRRRLKSVEVLSLSHACLHRSLAAMSSGMKAWYSSPRCAFSHSVFVIIVLRRQEVTWGREY